MKTRMDIELCQVVEGDSLAEDLRDGKGNLLLKAGVALQERTLNLLRQKGIGQIAVDREVPLDDAEIAAQTEQVSQQMEELFALLPMTPAAQQLKELFVRYHLRELN